MPRPPRLNYPGALHHVTLRCNNREFLFEPSSLELFQRFVGRMERRFGFSAGRKPLVHREFGPGIVAAGRQRGRPIRGK